MCFNKQFVPINVASCSFRVWVLVLTMAICVFRVGDGWANEKKLSFNIPGSSADQALNLFAQQADLQLIYPYDAISTIRIRGLSGSFTAEEGIKQLLRGTCLRAVINHHNKWDRPHAETYQGVAIVNNYKCKKKSFIAAISGVLLANLFGLPAHAQTENTNTRASAVTRTIEEITVTAQKREQNLQDVPISLDVISSSAVSINKIDTAIDLAFSAPSINFQQGFMPVASSFGMRGINTFGTSGGLQPSVSFVIDGVPIARVGEFQAELGDIQRIEILRGPQGTLFGRNALAGAINIVRKNPTEYFEAYVESSVTDDGEYIGRIGVSGPLSDNVRGRVSAYGKKLENYIENRHPDARDEGGEENFGLLGKLDIDFSEDVNLLLSAEYSRQNTDLAPNSILVGDTDPDIFNTRLLALGNGDLAAGKAVFNDPFVLNANGSSYADAGNWGLSADLSWELGDGMRIKSISAYRYWDVASEIDVDGTPASILDPMGMPVVGFRSSSLNKGGLGSPSYYFETDYFSQELRLESSSDQLDWILGGYYQKYTDRNKQETALLLGGIFFTDPVRAEAKWETWAMFGDMTWHLSDRLNVFAGLRWTVEDTVMNDYSRTDSSGPAVAPFFMPINSNVAVIDMDALMADPFWSGLQGEENFNSKTSSEDWSGRIGASLSVTDEVNVYVTASRGFVGSGVKLGRDSRADNTFVDPSVAESYEIGMKGDWLDNRLRTNLALFRTEVSDLQTSRLIPERVETTTFNAGDLVSQGVEANITWHVTDNLMLDLSGTLLDTKLEDLLQPCYPGQTVAQGCSIDQIGDGVPESQDVSGNSITLAPDLSYRLLARYDFILGSMPFDAFAQISYTWQDDTHYELTFDPMTEQQSYGLTDVVAGIQDRQGRYEASVFGKNVGDETFYSQLSSADGVIGRVYGRVTRQSQSYYGIRVRYNF
ncbi:MAG: TonB-dependent receptor [Pseudomonadota bacterium]|nr:TonB-dependent receptor [Pseudomonadota bacterium]